MDWTTISVALLTGLAASIATAVLTPFAKWHVEKQKAIRAERSKALIEARTYLQETSTTEFLKSIEYSRIRPFLDSNLVRSVEYGRSVRVQPDGRKLDDASGFKATLLDELSQVERRWDLI